MGDTLGRASPPESRVSLLAALTVAVATVPAWWYPFSQYDGGIVASAGTFTLHGLVPYLDYWLLYGPLPGVLLAGPLAVAGPSVELLRFLGLLTVVAQAALGASLALKWTHPLPAIAIVVAAVVTTPLVMGLELSSWSIAMTLALLAFNLRAARATPLIIGLVVGATFLARLDVGGYLLLALLVASRSRGLATGFFLVAVPVVAVLVALIPVQTLIEQLLWYPLVGPREFRGLPGLEATSPANVACFLTVTVAVIPRIAIVGGLLHAYRTRSPDVASLAVFAAMCQAQTLGRPDLDHLAMASAPAILLVAALPVPRGLRGTALIGIVVGASIVTAGLAVRSKSLADHDIDRELVAAVDVTRSVSNRDDRIFVGLTSNRFTAANPLIAYYLADRAPGSRTTMYNPGVATTHERQATMIRELTESGTDVLILSKVWSGAFEPWNASRYPGSDLLDEYIEQHFRKLCDFGSVVVAVRVGADMPTWCPSVVPG